MHTPSEMSPYCLIQEDLRNDPWKFLVACMMLNQTTAVQVKQVMPKFFEKYPSGGCVAPLLNHTEMADLIRPLGLYNRRAKAIIRMSQDFIRASRDNDSANWLAVQEFYGIGKYATDSYRIFVLGECPPEDAVQDKELKKYVRWAHGLK
jgi:methyl-CpG-binding domain protein 4